MRKNFKGKTVYIKDGVELEQVRDILFKNGESVIMGYDDSYPDGEPVNRGYLYRTRNKWWISLNKNEKLEVISIDELKLL